MYVSFQEIYKDKTAGEIILIKVRYANCFIFLK